MVFNTVTAGTNPHQVVPGYYYWDGTGQQWVSLSTTVGNVMNQAIYRTTASTAAGSVVTWNNRFNNIASGDLTITSNQEFQLANGFYKIEWGLPYQNTETYNQMQLQEFVSGSWIAFEGSASFSSVGNGGSTNWGGGTYLVDAVNCSLVSRKFRILNNDGASRQLLTGAVFIITKLNPSITTSTTADNLGNHTATKNIQLSGNFISNDGDNEGIRIDNSGNVNVTGKLNVTDPTGSVSTKLATRFTAGTFVTFDNLRFSVTTAAPRGLSIATVSGTVNLYVEGSYNNGGIAGTRTASPVAYTTTPSASLFGWGFNSSGDTIIYHLTDADNGRLYRVTLIIMPSYIDNFIAIERLY